MPADSPVAWTAGLLRARALEDQERYDEAVALLETMAQEQPDAPGFAGGLGDLLRGEDRFAEAEAAYTRAIERLPAVDRRHWRLLYARGIAFERTKRWPQAEADLLKALELEPEQPFVLNYLGYSWVDQGLQPRPGQGHAAPGGRAAAGGRLHRRQPGLGLFPPGRARQGGHLPRARGRAASPAIR